MNRKEAMDDEFWIKIEVLGKRHRLYIPRKDEEIMRDASKLLTEIYNEYVDAASKDVKELRISEQELTALTAFEFAYRTLKAGKEADLLPFIEKIGKLDAELSEYLEVNKKL
jgi:hypothetical protein